MSKGRKTRRKFKGANRGQYSLLPPSIEEWLPENHLARFVVEAVDQLDLDSMYDSYGTKGSPPYDPSLLLGLLFYGYASGIFSSRKLEAATWDSVAFRYISGNLHPDHDTIAEFRKRFLSRIEELFVEILLLARQMGFAQVGQVNVDGTKMGANASKHHAMSYEYMEKLEVKYKAEVARLLELAQAADDQDEELDIPAELSRREARLAKLAEAKAVLEARAKAKYEAEKAEYEAKMAARKAKEEATGKKTRGRPPQPPKEEVDPKSQYNFTDPESRIMPTRKGFEQSYNAQAAVTNDMFVVATELSDKPNDKEELIPVLEAIDPQLGEVDCAAADTGYFSQDNIAAAQRLGIEPYIATGRQAHNQWLDQYLQRKEEEKAQRAQDEQANQKEEQAQEEWSAKARMKQKLATEAGREIYRKRKMTVEPVFGIIKEAMGFRRFSLRGKEAARGEWSLVCSAYNLRRLFSLAMKVETEKKAQNEGLLAQKRNFRTQARAFLKQAFKKVRGLKNSYLLNLGSLTDKYSLLRLANPTGC
jgi:transposase